MIGPSREHNKSETKAEADYTPGAFPYCKTYRFNTFAAVPSLLGTRFPRLSRVPFNFAKGIGEVGLSRFAYMKTLVSER
jgi:hypothetical protein